MSDQQITATTYPPRIRNLIADAVIAGYPVTFEDHDIYVTVRIDDDGEHISASWRRDGDRYLFMGGDDGWDHDQTLHGLRAGLGLEKNNGSYIQEEK